MSAVSEKVRKALYAKSNVSAVVGSGKLTAIYDSKAPEDATLPYGIFQRQAPGTPTYGFGTTAAPTKHLESDLWLFKVLADEDSSTTKEPQEFAEDMAETWKTTLGNTLTLSGNTVRWMVWFADMPQLEEQQGDRYIYHRGFQLRIGVE
jgi:hypothetical protein